MNATEVYRQAAALGLTLERSGDALMVYGASEDVVSPDLAAALRRHKRELLALIENTTGLPPDQARWLPVAHQILHGEFDDCDRSTRESLIIGLRGIEHPLCRGALEWVMTTNV